MLAALWGFAGKSITDVDKAREGAGSGGDRVHLQAVGRVCQGKKGKLRRKGNNCEWSWSL